MPTKPTLATPLTAAAAKLRAVVAEVGSEFIERADSAKLIAIALVAGENLIAYGRPGTGKSALVRAITGRITGARYFEKLLTKFTTIEEGFGPMSIHGLQQDRFERKTEGYAADAHVVFFDEVGKANSAFMNTNLTLMNEKVFHNGTAIQLCPLVSLIGASNEVPDSDELQAFNDRFLLRDFVEYVSDGGFKAMLGSAPASTPTTITLDELLALNGAAKDVAIPDSILDKLLALRTDLRNEGFVSSDRRWKKALKVLQAHALYHGRDAVAEDDLEVLVSILWNLPEQLPLVAQKVLMASNPLKAQAVAIFDTAKDAYDVVAKLTTRDKNEIRTACMEANTKLQGSITELERIVATNPGADLTKVREILEKVQEFNKIVVKKGFGV